MYKEKEVQEQAIKHREQYCQAMIAGNSELCYKIEQYYALDGYPPEIVSVGLNAACEGKDPWEAVDMYLEGK